MMSPHPRERVSPEAIRVWLGAVAVYIVAITGRTSFGVASVDAIDHFHVDASRIAVFTAVQVGVYALAQIPVGLMIDRFGPRVMLVSGAFVMAGGQILLGFAESYSVAIFARVFIGAGDATAFLSVLRLLPVWFPPRKTPLFTQLTAAIGQLGQFLSAIPFLLLLHAAGWTAAFVSLGAVGVLVACAAAVAVVDSPESRVIDKQRHAPRVPLGQVLSTVLRSPLCWEALCIHGLGMFFMVNFALLWGMPLMTLGMGLTPTQGGTVLTVFTVATMIGGPFLGPLSAYAGRNRDLAAVAIASIHCAAWVFFFSSPSPRGFTAILIVAIIMGVATPVSNFGFDSIREHMPHAVVASGTGLGNMGGFLAGMLSAQIVGFILSHSSPDGAYTWDNFRLAWIAVFVIWGVLLSGLFSARARVRRARN